jgi:hypothetical protein
VVPGSWERTSSTLCLEITPFSWKDWSSSILWVPGKKKLFF